MNDAPNGPWGTVKIQTAAVGTNYVKLAEQRADRITISSATALEVRKVGATDGVLVPANTPFPITVALSAAEIEVRRFDTSNTQVAVTYLWHKANY
jgi:hypothetical protein